MPVIDLLSDDSVLFAIASRAADDLRAVPLAEKLNLLVYELERQTAANVFATVSDGPLSLLIFSGRGITATVWADYFDRRPAKNGWPAFHYRVQFKTEDTALSEEYRSEDAVGVASMIIAKLELA
jgi:hypothetical protein